MYQWDSRKAASNLAKHGIPFDAAKNFDWEVAIERRDTRKHDEVRTIAMSFIDDRLYVMVLTRRSNQVRIISLRKANKDEIEDYVLFTE
jgi:uncharacterized protein